MNCDDCDFADWKRTANGRLHPDKSGRCTRLELHPLDLRLPEAFAWPGWAGAGNAPRPSGGYIERGKELRRECEFKSRMKR